MADNNRRGRKNVEKRLIDSAASSNAIKFGPTIMFAAFDLKIPAAFAI